MAIKDIKTSELPVATVVNIDPNEPYPEGSPPDPAAVVARVHTAQEITEAAHWQAQSEENLAAGGIIAGAEAYVPAEPEVRRDAGLRSPKR
jgi:hypothetical protein